MMTIANQKDKKTEIIQTMPEISAKTAGLYYVSDNEPGIRRKRCGRGFSYMDENGRLIRDPGERSRLEALRIPPAWTDVWICPRPDGHLQATGRDEKGRKQYLYHNRWRQQRSQVKYDRMLLFGEALPEIRKQVDEDLVRRGLPREKVLATVVRLLELTLIRVGNKAYARANKSFGLTTMRDRHTDIFGSRLQFHFRGKSGKVHIVTIRDRRLAGIVKKCRDIPGYELFQYYDEDSRRHNIDSSDINAYLQEITGQNFTAKDFRTWGGTITTVLVLKELGPPESQAAAERNIREAIKQSAQQLGNRPATSRKYYVHPAVLEAYQEGTLLPLLELQTETIEPPSPWILDPLESTLMLILRQNLNGSSG